MKEKLSSKKEKLSSKIKMDIIAIVISILAVISSIVSGIVIPLYIQKEDRRIEREMRIQAAIPAFRIVHNMTADDSMEIFPPYREPQYIRDNNGQVFGKEIYYAIKDFSIQNLSNNLVYFSHIEYDNEAFELVNLGLVAKENEVITLLDNKFVGYYPQTKFYIICRSIYNFYYSFECELNLDNNLGEICTYTVEYIGSAKAYDINNDVYKNMYKHIRDIQMPPNIIL